MYNFVAPAKLSSLIIQHPLPKLIKENTSNFQQRSSRAFAINAWAYIAGLWNIASKNWVRLEHNYCFCIEFIEEIWHS